MFSNLENAIIVTAAIWGVVKLVQHFAPAYYELHERKYWHTLEDRIQKLEDEKKPAAKTVAKAKI